MSTATLVDTRVALANDSSVLGEITTQAVELAVWRRARPCALGWIDNLEWNGIDDLDFVVTLTALYSEIAEGLVEAGYPMGNRMSALSEGVAAHVSRFAAIVGCDAVRLRLEVVETDACRRFHSDHVTVRLLTTLFGPGTQWIETGSPEQVNQLAVGEVAIFKGRLWAENPTVLHRSPPITDSGDTRLLLAIDPFYPNREDWHG